jgi:phosphopantothenoylcysteine decarboxylase/phosphopantothenate--cysteine ligase
LPINRIDVVSAQQMYQAVFEYYDKVAIAIAAAAVADYKPKNVANQKIKKSEEVLHIELTPTQDILSEMGKQKNKQYLVGFALETENELENAKGKLERKNLDCIVLNSLQDKGAGFKKNTNKISIIDKFKNISEFSLKSKADVATDIFNTIIPKLDA